MTGHGDIEIGDVDGLRAVRAPAPVEGRTFAALWFGSGVLHESVPERGINHLIEHLAFGAVRRLPGAVNAQVSLTGTGFFAEGSEDECVAVLRGVCEALGRLPVEGLERERNILAAEAQGRGDVGRALAHRFGLAGAGLAWSGCEEYGLRHLGPAALDARVAHSFTVGNAALFTTGDPERFALPLAPGLQRPLPKAPGSPPLPAWEAGPGDGVELTGVIAWPRPAGSGTALEAFHDAALEELRHRRGIVYSIDGIAERVAIDLQHAAYLTRFEPARAVEVSTALLDVLERLAADGPDDELLARIVERRRRALDDPRALFAYGNQVASELASGDSPQTFADVRAMLNEVSVESCAAVLREVRASLLVVAPHEATPHLGMGEVLRAAAPLPAGREHPYLRSASGQRLVIGDSAVGIARGRDPDDRVVIPLADVAALVERPANTVLLLGRDGSHLTISSNDVADGALAVRRLRDAVPSLLHVPKTAAEVDVDRAVGHAGGGITRTIAFAFADVLADEEVERLLLQDAGQGILLTSRRILVGRRSRGEGGASLYELLPEEIRAGARWRTAAMRAVAVEAAGRTWYVALPRAADRDALRGWLDRERPASGRERALTEVAEAAVAAQLLPRFGRLGTLKARASIGIGPIIVALWLLGLAIRIYNVG